MDILSIRGTSQFPEVLLEKSKGIIFFSGNSLPEDAKSFFEPIMNWIDNYIESPQEETTVKFRMIYYNTPSSKLIFQILKKLEALHLRTGGVKVLWTYPDDDIDMREAGVDYSEHIKIPFTFESYSE